MLTSFFQRPYLVVCPFTQSTFAPYCTGDHDVARISHIRKEEDDAFARTTGSYLTWWNLPTSALSSEKKEGSEKSPLLMLSTLFFGWPPPKGGWESCLHRIATRVPLSFKYASLREGSRLDKNYAFLEAGISYLNSMFPHATLVAPLGIGSHPDHITTSWACRSVRHRFHRVYFYEDLPYASECGSGGIVRFVRSFDRHLRPVGIEVSAVMEEKVRNLLLYSTQVSSHEVLLVRGHAKRVGHGASFERLWTY